MITNAILPLELAISKEFFRKEMLKQGALLIFFLLAFWLGSGRFFTAGYYYPQLMVAMVIGIIAVIATSIQLLTQFLSGKPIVVISRQGVQFCNRPFSTIGIIKWQDIAYCQEMAAGTKGRKLALFVKEPASYIANIQNYFIRKRVAKNCKTPGSALAFIRIDMLDYDTTELKQLIKQIIQQENNN